MHATNQELKHLPVLLNPIVSLLPQGSSRQFLDVTAGGGGHFFEILSRRPDWRGECWDRDPAAEERIRLAGAAKRMTERVTFRRRRFGDAPETTEATLARDFILADIGVSSFQLDDPTRGLSFRSDAPPDFRMDPSSGVSFLDWLRGTTESELARLFEIYGEEPRAKRIAKEMKSWSMEAFASAQALAERVKQGLGYGSHSRIHPATRVFQALRIAINDELGELERFLSWAPDQLAPGGRLAVISFHSLEDRIVKNRFRDLAASRDFVILTKKPIVPTEEEQAANPRARSAKLRVLERGMGNSEHQSGMEAT